MSDYLIENLIGMCAFQGRSQEYPCGETVRTRAEYCTACEAAARLKVDVSPSLTDDQLRQMWRSVQGPFADLNGPLIRFAALVRASGADDLTFQRFSEANRTRCEHPQGFHHALDSWSTSDWFLAVLGELGEAANIAKKLNRVRDGIPGNKESADVLHEKLRGELGDAFVYLDLLAQSLGVYIHEAAVEVFNAKSRDIGYPVVLERTTVAV